MDYTSEEITVAVEKLVRGSIRRQYGLLGNRDTATTFSDIQDAAAGVFFLYPNASFYIIELACRRTEDKVDSAIAAVSQLTDALQALRRNVQPIDSLSPLYNASAALTNLSNTIATRAVAFDNASETPAYQRFTQNIQRFLDTVSTGIKENGQIVATPAEIRTQLQCYFVAVQAAHEEVTRRVTLLANAVSDFELSAVRTTMQQMVLDGAQQVLTERTAELEQLTATERLTKLRDVTLDLLAAQAVLDGFSALAVPTTFLQITGSGAPFADAAHPATPAQLTSLAGPFRITSSAYQLKFLVNGTHAVTLAIQGSFPASLQGLIAEPYLISDGAHPGDPPQNDTFSIATTDQPDVTLTMAESVNKVLLNNAGNGVVQEIAAAITTQPITPEAYLTPLRWSGNVDITPNGALDGDFTTTDPAVDFTTLGIGVGDMLLVETGVNAGQVYELLVPPLATVITARRVYGAVTAADPGQVIRVGAALYLRIRIADAAVMSALATNVAIGLPATNDVAERALHTLGYFQGVSAVSRRTAAAEAVESVKSASSASLNDTTLLQASRTVDALLFSGLGRTEPTSRLKYVVYWMRGKCDVAAAGMTVTLTPSDVIPASVVVGGTVVLREAAVPAQIGQTGVITGVTASDITATFSVAITPTTDVLFEAGPTLVVPHDCVLVLSGGTAVDGEYPITYSGTFPNSVPFELPLALPLPAAYEGGFKPIFSTATLGQEHVVFSSTDTSLLTALAVQAVSNSAATEFFTGLPSTVGTTIYFQLPEVPTALEVGDVLELYGSIYSTPDSQHTIRAIELTGVIQLDTALPTDFGTITFDLNTPPPFARIRKLRYDTYGTLKAALDTWLSGAVNQSTFYTNLFAVINPLVSAGNPTLLQVNTALASLQQLSTALTNVAALLAAYDAADVPAVNVLISSFLEKGADRAVDLLLEGQFSTFFSLTQSQASYAGEVADALREVQREDIPIEKVGRQDAGTRTLLASYETVDPNYDLSDVDHTAGIDTPNDTRKPYPGASF